MENSLGFLQEEMILKVMCDWCFACKITMVLILLSNHGCHEDVWKLMFCSGLCATFSPVERCVLFWTCWWGRLQEVIEFEDYWCKLRLIIDMKEFKWIGTAGILRYRDIKKMSRMYQGVIPREMHGLSQRWFWAIVIGEFLQIYGCLLYTSPSPRDA